MSDKPQIQLNLDEVLAGFAETNAQVTQRAVLAEAGIKARDRIIDELATKVAEGDAEITRLTEARDAAQAVIDGLEGERAAKG